MLARHSDSNLHACQPWRSMKHESPQFGRTGTDVPHARTEHTDRPFSAKFRLGT
jgi:hypothetical protein